MTWEPTPLAKPMELEGHVGFTYVFTAEEVAYLEARGFERSVVAPESKWVLRRPGRVSYLAAVEIRPEGLIMVCTDAGVRATRKTGMELIPLLVWATIEGLL